MRAVGGGFCLQAFDIEGCYPNMPKEAILLAATELVAQLRRQGQKGVWIPRASTKKPGWCPPNKTQAGTWMPLQELVDILDFTLHNSFIRMPDGTILKQAEGIPMMESFCMGEVNYLNQRMRYSWMCCDPQESMAIWVL